jgi:hypothetical protein
MHRALSLAAAFRRRLRQITLTRLRRLDDARYFFHFHADDVSVLFRHTPPTLMPMFISSLFCRIAFAYAADALLRRRRQPP